ncbi:hypothetical protein K1719_030354 [Acacia pycnantha]|nr:hypothetical protein K1719_030354 [Acacia pycnantha]
MQAPPSSEEEDLLHHSSKKIKNGAPIVIFLFVPAPSFFGQICLLRLSARGCVFHGFSWCVKVPRSDLPSDNHLLAEHFLQR